MQHRSCEEKPKLVNLGGDNERSGGFGNFWGHTSFAVTGDHLGNEQAKALDIAKNHKMF